MARWECAIEGDGAGFDRPEDLLVHQATEHERIECEVCGAVVPDGYFAIRHAFEEHSRAEYVRGYNASASDVRQREEIKAEIEDTADIREAVDRIENE